MEDYESVETLMHSTSSKIQHLQKAFAELESHRAITLNMKWKQLEEHFHGLEKTLKRRFTELEDQEKEFETKIAQAKDMVEKREAAVVAKERASLEKLQEKRDAAVSSISVALKRHWEPFSLEPTFNIEDDNESSVMKVNNIDVTESNTDEDSGKYYDNRNMEVKSYPELVNLCQKMDSDGIHKFISDNRKDLTSVREEIPLALEAASDPASLVLDSLNGFYNSEIINSDAKKDANLLGIRRTCIMLMECLSILLSNIKVEYIPNIISESVKIRAKAIAEDWKTKLDGLDFVVNHGNSLEAHAFLQLLATFDISSCFDMDGLTKLIPMVCRRRQIADLCRSLGLSDKMPGVINVLVNIGRQVDAVNLACAFELTEQFPPAPLLKSYLNEASKVPSPGKSGNAAPTAQNDINEKELSALKAVIKCIEDHKLEEQYPVDALQKRVVEMERAKADKKRATEVPKPQPKRPRGNCARVANISTDKNFYARTTDRYPQYVYERQYAYTGPAEAHIPAFVGNPYNLSGPGNFFANGYHYQAAYLH
ncbi:unnamed protein product [Cuscuta epithymum]|uniref:FRIGIDA-like protein n=1 Tax=Cuscuta epithymum TaxID=186058 RepID=A0AAV0CH97_9ASTE|nr:unnamed protein product [Cuscuta epithymum]